jgi:2,4-dienoyl-CoA reductase (NADPH2)
VAIALGSKSIHRLWELLKEKVKEAYLIGDALQPRKALKAIHEGFFMGLRL